VDHIHACERTIRIERDMIDGIRNGQILVVTCGGLW
jgi:hypothetical protein